MERFDGEDFSAGISEPPGRRKNHSSNTFDWRRALPARRLPRATNREICTRSLEDLGGLPLFGRARGDGGSAIAGPELADAVAAAGSFSGGCRSHRGAGR